MGFMVQVMCVVGIVVFIAGILDAANYLRKRKGGQ